MEEVLAGGNTHDGEVVHPDHDALLVSDAALVAVAGLIRRFHDAVETFEGLAEFDWSDRGGDPTGAPEILCHSDLAPWNLVRHSRLAYAEIHPDQRATLDCQPGDILEYRNDEETAQFVARSDRGCR